MPPLTELMIKAQILQCHALKPLVSVSKTIEINVSVDLIISVQTMPFLKIKFMKIPSLRSLRLKKKGLLAFLFLNSPADRRKILAEKSKGPQYQGTKNKEES